jgi:hypothetical protein
LAAVHVANALQNEDATFAGGGPAALDVAYLERLGVADRVDDWWNCAGRNKLTESHG